MDVKLLDSLEQTREKRDFLKQYILNRALTHREVLSPYEIRTGLDAWEVICRETKQLEKAKYPLKRT